MGQSASTGLDSRAPSITRVHGRVRLALRIAWGVGVVVTLAPALASFILIFEEGALELLTRAGVFAINPSIVSGLEDLGFDHEIVLGIDLGFRMFGMAVFALTAIGIFLRRHKDWMTGLVSFTLLALGMSWFAPISALPEGSVLETIASFVGNPRPFEVEFGKSIAGLTIILFLYLFPDGQFVPRWTRYAAIGLGIHFVLWNVFAGSFIDPTTWSGPYQAVIVLLVVGSGLCAQLYRFFVSSAEQRARAKLVVAAICVVAIIPPLLFIFNPGLGAGLEGLTVVTPRAEILYNLVLLLILGIAMVLLPISIAVSVWRYRLWDMDLFINRTLVYGALTGVLGLAYFAILAAVSSVAQQSYLTAAVATLGVAILFQPARRRLQDVIDKHFYRSRYDATRKLEEFSARLRQQIDLKTLASEMLRTVRESMHPTGVSLWVKRSLEATDGSSGSTLHRIGFWVDANRATVLPQDFDVIDLDDETMEVFMDADEPVNLDDPDAYSEPLARFRSVDVRLTVPLVTQGELIGILNLGPRMSETGYSTDDLKLLDDLSDHAAAAVRVALLVGERDASLRERERIDNEMRVARLIQERFFPKELPDIPGWEIYAYTQAAREVGGDFYDFVELSDGRLAIVAGDVTGKGVPAALVMASTRSMLRSEAPRLENPGRILSHVNEVLIRDIPEQMFVTCLCVILDPSNGRIVFANAGHNLPYLRTDGEVMEKRATGLPLGLMPGIRYDEVEATIDPGTTVVLHSDGLAEARNDSKEMFGFHRVKSSLQRAPEPSVVIEQLLADLASFTGEDWEQDDDITLAVIHRKAEPNALSRPIEDEDGYALTR